MTYLEGMVKCGTCFGNTLDVFVLRTGVVGQRLWQVSWEADVLSPSAVPLCLGCSLPGNPPSIRPDDLLAFGKQPLSWLRTYFSPYN